MSAMMAMRSQLELSDALQARKATPAPMPAGQVIERVPFGEGFAWALEPYGACELETCATRLGRASSGANWLELGHSGSPRAQGVAVLVAHLREMAARDDRSFAERPVVLGAHCDPWQAAERDAQLTRQILEGLAKLRGVQLRATTRSSLVGRDVDLLSAIARTGEVRVSLALPAVDRRTWMSLEPHSPSPERRLMAIGLLARAGVTVGVEVGPILRGFNDSDAAIERILSRARDAGARFASARPLDLADGARERILEFAQQASPERVSALRRLLSRPHLFDARGWGDFSLRFAKLCKRFDLAQLPALDAAAPARVGGPRQLSLF